MKFNEAAYREIVRQIQAYENVRLTDSEFDWVKKQLRYIKPAYRHYLANLRLDPELVHASLNSAGDLTLHSLMAATGQFW